MMPSMVLVAMRSPLLIGLPLRMDGEQHVVLVLVHVVLLAVRTSSWSDLRCAAAGRGRWCRTPFGAHDVVGVLVVAAFDLAVGNERAHIVRVQIVHFEMIVDVAALVRRSGGRRRRRS